MIYSDFKRDAVRLESCGFCKWKNEIHIQDVHDELKHISPAQWNIYVERAKRETMPPKNIVAWFLNEHAQYRQLESKSDPQAPDRLREISASQHDKFTRIVDLSLAVYSGEDYQGFWNMFSDGWTRFTGIKLDEWLDEIIAQLKTFPVVRGAFLM
jgi:hypothetical protein